VNSTGRVVGVDAENETANNAAAADRVGSTGCY
jgi:hypothetical protein